MSFCQDETYFFVDTKQGKLRGKESTSEFNGKKYCSFLGIPYAKPPIGELRFKPPEDPLILKNIHDATQEGRVCHQSPISFFMSIHVGSEDCLYLNVYTPEPPREIITALPVMFYIHGGAFIAGCGMKRLRSPDFLMDKNIILVTINYRLHALGFLNLGIEQCPGNVGLKDQTFALKWVQNNIRCFGGDPDNVTIFGESAGSSSVHYHMISPLSQGLFHKAIMQSGSVQVPWAFTENPIEQAFSIGREVKYTGDDRHELLNVLKSISAGELLTAVEKVLKKNQGYDFRFPNLSPSVEVIAEGAFLPDTPEKLLKLMKPIPVIYGMNNKEGMMIHMGYNGDITKKLRDKFPSVFKEYFNISPDQISNVSEQVKQLYFGKLTIASQHGNEITDLFTELYFYHFYETIDMMIKSKIHPHVYLFSYDGSLNIGSNLLQIMKPFARLKDEGACHGDELGYLFYHKTALIFRPKIIGEDLKMVELMTTMWTNFAKFGNPSTDEIEWNPTTANKLQYMNINQEPSMKTGKIRLNRSENFHRIVDSAIESKL